MLFPEHEASAMTIFVSWSNTIYTTEGEEITLKKLLFIRGVETPDILIKYYHLGEGSTFTFLDTTLAKFRTLCFNIHFQQCQFLLGFSTFFSN